MPQIPNPPGIPWLAQGGGSDLIVTWTDSPVDSAHDPAIGYNLYFSPSGFGTWTMLSGVTSPYDLSGLPAGAAIDVQLQSWNATGSSVLSGISTFTTAVYAPNAMAVPTVAPAPDGTNSNLIVTWTAPVADSTHSPATRYNLAYIPSGGTQTVVVGVTCPYTITGLGGATAVQVKIRGTNAAPTYGPWTAFVTATTWGITVAPGSMTAAASQACNASVAPDGGLQMTATPAPTAVTGAAFAWSTSNSVVPTSGLIAADGDGQPNGWGQWCNTPAAAGTYYLWMLAQGAGGATAGALVSSAIIAEPQIPNAPGLPSLAQGSGSDLIVTWTASPIDSTHNAATGYNLLFSPSGLGTWTTVSGVTSPYDLSGLPAGAAIDVQLQGLNASGCSALSGISTLTTAVFAPNAMAIPTVAPAPDGTTMNLTVTWTAPPADSTHSPATGYNLRYSPSGAATWTIVVGVTCPYTITGLGGATAIDVGVRGTNAAPTHGPWTTTVTATTWGITVAPGEMTAASTQVHNASVAPGGGLQMTATPAPTAVTGTAFAWSTSNSTVPTSGLITADGDGQPNGWGQWCNTPATAGTYYLWMLAQGAGGVTAGALVSSAITVT